MGQSGSTGNELCLKPACLHAASHVIQNLAPNWETLDPCTDFFQMACGGAAERWADDTQAAGNFMQDRIDRILRKVIESPYEEAVGYHSIMVRNNIDEANHRMLQRDYQSCMNTEALLEAGSTPLINVLAELAKVWPGFDPDDTTTLDTSEYEDLNKAIIHLEQLGVSSFRVIDGTPGVAFPFISDPDVVLPVVAPMTATNKNTSVYGDEEALETYAGHIATAFSGGLYPTNISESQAQTIARDVVLFEARLVVALETAQVEWQAQVDPEDEGSEFVKISFDDLASLAPALGLDKTVSFFVPADYKGEVMISHLGFFTNASAIIEETSKTALQSWLAWRTIVSLADDVFDSFTQTTVQTAIGSSPRQGKQWQQCLAHTEKSLVWIMDRYFVSASYTEGMKDLVAKMTTNVQTALVNRFSELDWMTDPVKARAIDKAQKMNHNIGFPTKNPDLHSPNSLAAYYQGLEITDDYFSNVLAARLNNLRSEYASIGKPYDRTKFTMASHTVNAYFSPWSNSITINAAVSQPLLFHPDLPSYAVYGDMGANTIGHEITHGFDNRGHTYDEAGASKGWFDNATSAGFLERAQCFVEEYSKYEVPITGGKMGKVNGEVTLGENLSDVGGLRLAFEAWKALSGSDKKSDNLPGLENFTHEQLFYLFWANGYCQSTISPEISEHLLEIDNHSPGNIRIDGGTQHSRGFKEAWGCKVREPKCELF